MKQVVRFYLRRLQVRLRAVSTNCDGVSAIEFALIFPVLLVIFAGTVDFGQALVVHRKLDALVSTLGDIIAQKSSWKTSDVDGIIAGTSTFIYPYSSTNLQIKLAVVDISDKLVPSVNWSRAFNTTALLKGASPPFAITANVMESGVQLIAVNATFKLTTPFSSFLSGITGTTDYTYNKKFLARPRINDNIELN